MAVTIREVVRDVAETDVVLNTSSSTAVGDVLLLVQATDHYPADEIETPTGGGTWNGPVVVGRDDDTTSPHIKVWWREVTTGGSQTVQANVTQDPGNHAHLFVLVGADTTDPVSGAAATTGFGTDQAAPSVTGVEDGMLVCGWISDDAPLEYAAPAGMVEDDTTELNPWSTTFTAAEALDADGATGTRTATIGAGNSFTAVSVGIAPAASAPVEIIPDGASHTQTAGSPTLTQVHTLTPAQAGLGHTATSSALAQTHALAAASAGHGHSVTQPALTQTHTVTVQGAVHGHAAGQSALSQVHAITSASAVNGHTADSPAVDQAHIVATTSASHSHAAGTPTVAQLHVLAAGSAGHGHEVTTPQLAQAHHLAAHDTTHGHTVGQPVLTFGIVVAAHNAAHGSSAGSVALTQLQLLTLDDAVHTHTAGSSTVSPHTDQPAPLLTTSVTVSNTTAEATPRSTTREVTVR